MEPVDPRVDRRLLPDGSVPVVIAEHQEEYKNLPSIRTPDGYVVTRWTLTEEERRRILAGDDIFVTLLSFGPINPFFVTVGPVDWKAHE